MMILDVRKLNRQREYEGTLSFEVEPTEDFQTLPLAKIASPVQVSGEYEIFDDDSVEIRGKVRYLLQGACNRCLKETSKEIVADWCPIFEKGKADEDNYSYDGEKIDLYESVREAVLASTPYVLLCSDDCKGIEW